MSPETIQISALDAMLFLLGILLVLGCTVFLAIDLHGDENDRNGEDK